MFKDRDRALKELEAELLEEEALEEEYEEEYEDADILEDEELKRLLGDTQVIESVPVYRNHANDYGRAVRAYNGDRTEQSPEALSQELLEEPEGKGTTGLIVLACTLAAGILCVALWWFLRYRGLF